MVRGIPNEKDQHIVAKTNLGSLIWVNWTETRVGYVSIASCFSGGIGDDGTENSCGLLLAIRHHAQNRRSPFREALTCYLEEIVEDKSRVGFFGYMRSLVEARQKRPSVIAPAKHDVSSYDLVVVGTPVWAWSVSSPVRAYLMANRDRLPEVADLYRICLSPPFVFRFPFVMVGPGNAPVCPSVRSQRSQTRRRLFTEWSGKGCPIFRLSANAVKIGHQLAPGDVVTVTRIDRLARSTFDLFAIVKQIVDAKAQFRSLAEPWADTGTSTGRLMIAVLGGLADVERDLIRTRTAEGRNRAQRFCLRAYHPKHVGEIDQL
jgi:hypothetical protein